MSLDKLVDQKQLKIKSMQREMINYDIDLSKIRLGICMPHVSHYFHRDFVNSFFCLDKPLQSIYITPQGGHELDVIRNQLVDKAKEYQCTHLWMCDTDQIYPQNTLMKLLSHQKDVVTAKVHRRYPPYDPVMFRGEKHRLDMVPDSEWKDGGLIEVDATGCGSVLYDMKVLNQQDDHIF